VNTKQSETPAPTWNGARSIWLTIVVLCFYVLAAKMSLALLTPDGVAVFWPAAGVAAGTLVAIGASARWAVVVATIAATIIANLMGDRNLSGAVTFAICNAVEAVLVAALVERYFGSPFDLNRLSHVLGLLGAAAVAATISGIGGAIGFAVFYDPRVPIFRTWQNWFASDALGIITVAPLVIGLVSMIREPPRRKEVMEGLAALVALIVISAIVIVIPSGPWATVLLVALLFPILFWIAARCGPLFAAAATFTVTLGIVLATTIGIGNFGGSGLAMTDRVFAARLGILAVALCSLVFAALFTERRSQASELAETSARLQEALTASSALTFMWNVTTGSLQRSSNAAQVLGFDPQKAFGASSFLAQVHEEDRERLRMLVRRLAPELPSYSTTFRFSCLDGREIWLQETAEAQFDGIGRMVVLKGFTLDVTARKHYEDQKQSLKMA
jgi:PAS domain S-box-containing protein